VPKIRKDKTVILSTVVQMWVFERKEPEDILKSAEMNLRTVKDVDIWEKKITWWEASWFVLKVTHSDNQVHTVVTRDCHSNFELVKVGGCDFIDLCDGPRTVNKCSFPATAMEASRGEYI
jgi:hypothetical protein